jgi:glycosyltransferase involved in cell wall biosynthesis
VSGLRFCFLTTFYPPYSFGGDGVAIQRLARGLVRRGHHITVIHDIDAYTALTRSQPLVRESEPSGLQVVPLRSGVGRLSALLTQQLGHPVLNGRRIARILREGEFDVINFHNVSLIGGPGLLKHGRDGRVLKVYMAHEHWLVCPTHVLWRHGREPCPGRQCLRCQLAYRRPPQLWRWTGLLERYLDQIDVFIAMSEFSREKHREFGFVREMEVLPAFLPDVGEEGTAVGDVLPPQERPYFLFVGRLERIKGLQEVIPLFAEYRGADLLIAGEGEYRSELCALAAGMERVHFLGQVPPEGLARYYRHAIALIVPSLGFETFGLVLVEAFRQATPVIARRLGPFPEIVEASGAGELFSNPDELVAAMRRLQGDADLRARLGAAGQRAFRDRWSEDVVVPRYLEIVASAAKRRRHVRLLEKLRPRIHDAAVGEWA